MGLASEDAKTALAALRDAERQATADAQKEAKPDAKPADKAE